MARKSSSIVGIDLQESAVRAVHVVYRGGRGKVVAWDTAPLHEGLIRNGVVHDVGSVAVVVKTILESMKASTSAVAFGISGGTQYRNLKLPPVPEAELPAIVDVEVEHQQVLRTAHSVYSYIPFASAGRVDGLIENVGVFTTETETVHALQMLLEQAGLKVEAVEPISYAMHRAALSHDVQAGSTLTLNIGRDVTELGLVDQGQLISYRRIEIGSVRLLSSGASSAPPVAGIEGQSDVGDNARHINVDELDSLAIQSQRIIDYFQREFSGAANFDGVLLTIDDPQLQPLAEELAKRVNLPVELVSPIQNELSQRGETSGGPEFSAAFGLAMWGDVGTAQSAPPIDLFSQERVNISDRTSKRNLVGSLVVSGVAIFLGVISFFLYGVQIFGLKESTQINMEKAEQIRAETDLEQAEQARRSNQYRALRREGVPITAIVGAIAQNLDPDAGVSSVSVDENLRVIIAGEATSEAPMIRTVQLLQQNPVLTGITIDSFNRREQQSGINFQLSAETVPLSRIKTREEVDREGL